jgi:glycogen operon protein
VFGYDFGDPDSRNDDDSAAAMMKGVVVNPFFDWAGDRLPKTPYAETVIYEAHVKGLTSGIPTSPRRSAAPTARSRIPPSSSTSSTSA